MRKLLLLGILAPFLQTNLAADGSFDGKHHNKDCKEECEPTCQTTCPRGPQGDRGDRGNRGPRGPTGIPGIPLGIDNYIEVTSTAEQTTGGFISFSPIATPATGIRSPLLNGISLTESVIGSGILDTITLPVLNEDADYLVSYGVSQANLDNGGAGIALVPDLGSYQLFLNGTLLPYTEFSFRASLMFIEKTSVVRNPANTAGILRFYSSASDYFLTPPTSNGFSASMTVVKLNQNGAN